MPTQLIKLLTGAHHATKITNAICNAHYAVH